MFLSVARMGSISQASEVENVAASAISKRISDLEDQIGTPLFYRQARGVELTPAGNELARRLYSDAHLARVGFGNKKIFFYIIVTLMKDRCYIKNILVPYPELFLVVLTK